MKIKVKLALFAVSAGAIALATGACIFRWLGDAAADSLWLRAID